MFKLPNSLVSNLTGVHFSYAREKTQFVAPDGVLEAHATMYSCE